MVERDELSLPYQKAHVKVACKDIPSDSEKSASGLTLFAELNPHPVFRFSSDGTFLLANPAAQSVFAAQIAAEMKMGDFFPETRDLNLKRIIKKDLTIPLKIVLGSSFFQAHIRGVSASDFLNIYLSDITHLERIKNEIEEDRVETEQLIASIKSILIGLDNEGQVTRWNAEAVYAFGVEVHEAMGRHVDQCIHAWSLGKFDAVEGLMEGERYKFIAEGWYKKADGSDGRHIDVVITHMFSLDGKPSGYLILAHDTSEKKKLELQLLQAQKLESLGQLAAGIAHEINTPIQFISDNTHFLGAAFERLDKVLSLSSQLIEHFKTEASFEGLVAELEATMQQSKFTYMRGEIPFAIEESLKGLDQVASIVRGMKKFSHPGSGDKTLTNINECLQDTITISRNEWKYVAELVTELGDDLPPVLCHPNEINQVFLNLIVNAGHAIKKCIDQGLQTKGAITVRSSHEDEYVNIEISDTGTGIPKEVLPKIFDPFFTTKAPGKGTGQGLSIAYSTITGHGGDITVSTVEGEGTTFMIQLPAYVEAA